jgi:triosephosphate isomerase
MTSMLVVANWKAYVEDVTKARELLAKAKRLARTHGVTIVLAPPGPLLGLMSRARLGHVALAAQDVSATTGGAYTGEVTAAAFGAVGASYAIVGHSERRAAGDTDIIVAEKLRHALARGLTPILCTGEVVRDREGRYLSLIRESLITAFSGLTQKERMGVIVSYEPVWAIGKTAADAIAPTDLHETVLYVRKVLAELLPGRGAARAQILYGGSVEPGNARDLAAETGIDGFLVGHASVDTATFSMLIKSLS